jgi:hypothetical protein
VNPLFGGSEETLWPFCLPSFTHPIAPSPGAFPPLAMSGTDFLRRTPSSKDCTTTAGVLCEPIVPQTTSDGVFG